MTSSHDLIGSSLMFNSSTHGSPRVQDHYHNVLNIMETGSDAEDFAKTFDKVDH